MASRGRLHFALPSLVRRRQRPKLSAFLPTSLLLFSLHVPAASSLVISINLLGNSAFAQALPSKTPGKDNLASRLALVKPAQILALKDLTDRQRIQIMLLKGQMHRRLLPIRQARNQASISASSKSGKPTSGGQMGGAILGGLIDVNSNENDENSNSQSGQAAQSPKPASLNATTPQKPATLSPVDRQIMNIKKESLDAMLKVLTAAQRKRLAQLVDQP